MLKQFTSVISEEVQYSAICLKHQLFNGRRHSPAKVLVNGGPKTGTTWMKKMITAIPGYRAVGNFGGEIKRYHNVQPGDVVHGHNWHTPELRQILSSEGIKVVLMVRDPRDQLVSRMFHIKRSEQHAWHEGFKDLSNDEALMLCIEGREGLPGTDKMITLTQTWLNGGTETLCVKYEELLADTVTHFASVLKYLGIDNHDLAHVISMRNRFERLSVGRRIWQAQRGPGQEDANSHFRKGIIGDWKNRLNETHKQKFKEIAGQQLIELGYERDMNW